MRISRRNIAWTAFALVLVVAIVVLTQQRDVQSPAADVDQTVLPEAEAVPLGQADPPRRNAAVETPTWFARIREQVRNSSDPKCVRIVNDTTSFLEAEAGSGVKSGDKAPPEEWINTELAGLQGKAAGARDPELLLASVLLHESGYGDVASNQTMLLDLGTRAAASSSPLLAWHALRTCAEMGLSCPYAHLEQDLLDRQRNNAEAWALVATLRYQRRDIGGALAAMQAAAGASTSTWHWPETIELVERSVAAHTGVTFPDSAATAAGVAVLALPDESVLKMCREESASSRAWGEACLAFGTLRQEHNEGEISTAIAIAIRSAALTAMGDTEGAVESQEAQHRFDAERTAGGLELVVAGGGLQNALITGSRARFRAYLDLVRQSGVIEARRALLRQELPPIVQRAGLLEREEARECLAGLFLQPPVAGESRQARLDYRLQPGDELHITLTGPRRTTTLTRRVGADGTFSLTRGLSLRAAEVTTEQFQRELAAAISAGGEPPEVLVIPIPRRPGEELRSAFDAARSGQ